eukprot:217949-Pelagomonas_calceolata.AAC.2
MHTPSCTAHPVPPQRSLRATCTHYTMGARTYGCISATGMARGVPVVGTKSKPWRWEWPPLHGSCNMEACSSSNSFLL